VRGHRADHQVVAPVADAVQAGRPVQVHHHVRVGQPQPEDREQALPAARILALSFSPRIPIASSTVRGRT
jgi:hypothetical protein